LATVTVRVPPAVTVVALTPWSVKPTVIVALVATRRA
jgi:hypothetical protein